MDLPGLPATAFKALGVHLAPADAAACRLASKQLAAVTAPKSSKGHVQVVASYFQSQLQIDREKECANASAAAAAAAPATATVARSSMPLAAADQVGDAETATESWTAASDAPAAAAVATPLASFQHLHLVAAATAAPATGATGDSAASKGLSSDSPSPTQLSSSSTGYHSGTSEIPTLSSTAKSLARAAAAYSCAVIYIDADVAYHEDTWQQLFSALACCPSVRHLHVIQCRHPGSDPHSASPAATAASWAWLPALVSLLKPQLQQLQLQLVDSIPEDLQQLLLELQGLQTLDITGSDLYGRTVAVHPTLLPGTVVRLSQLEALRSLKCRMEAVERSSLPDTVVQLQQTFKQLGKTLTQLDFGLADRSQQIALSAPLQDMPLLQSLTCQPGFTLDAEDILYPELDLDLGNVKQSGSSGVTSLGVAHAAAPAAAAILVPSLTQLILNEGDDHGPLFRLLADGTCTAAAASRTLLQHVELNSPAGVPFELLGRLSGLHSLKFGVWQDSGYDALRELAAHTSLASQLSGLTVVCDAGNPAIFIEHRPIQELTSLTSLTSLRIVGSQAMYLNVPDDLHTLQTTMPALTEFSFVTNHDRAGFFHDELSRQRAHHVKTLDAGLIGNQLRVLDLELDGKCHGATCLRWSGEQQQRLASLKVVGCSSCIGRGKQRFLGEMKPDSSSSHGAGVQHAGSSSSSSSCGGQCCSGCSYPWPDLVQLAVAVDGLAAAKDFASLNRALPDLTLDLRPELVTTDCVDSSSSSGGIKSSSRILWDESRGPMPGLADLWPHLTSLKLTVPGAIDYILYPTLQRTAAPKGLDQLLLGLSRLTRLEHLSLTCCRDSANPGLGSLPSGCVPSFAFLHSLARLQTLELNFPPPSMISTIQGPLSQTVCDELGQAVGLCKMLAGHLKHCGRLRRVVLNLGQQLGISERQSQQLLQRSVSNCVVCVQRESQPAVQPAIEFEWD